MPLRVTRHASPLLAVQAVTLQLKEINQAANNKQAGSNGHLHRNLPLHE